MNVGTTTLEQSNFRTRYIRKKENRMDRKKVGASDFLSFSTNRKDIIIVNHELPRNRERHSIRRIYHNEDKHVDRR